MSSPFVQRTPQVDAIQLTVGVNAADVATFAGGFVNDGTLPDNETGGVLLPNGNVAPTTADPVGGVIVLTVGGYAYAADTDWVVRDSLGNYSILPATIFSDAFTASLVVQSGSIAGFVAALTLDSGHGWAAPTLGNLLVLFTNSNSVIGSLTGAGWTSAANYLADMDFWVYYKVSDGTETAITVTPATTDDITLIVVELYATAVGAYDVTSAVAAVSGGSDHTAQTINGVTTTGTHGDVIFGVACTHGGGSGGAVDPAWDNNFVLLRTAVVGSLGSAQACSLFVATKQTSTPGATGSTTCSWTNPMTNSAGFHVAFKLV